MIAVNLNPRIQGYDQENEPAPQAAPEATAEPVQGIHCPIRLAVLQAAFAVLRSAVETGLTEAVREEMATRGMLVRVEVLPCRPDKLPARNKEDESTRLTPLDRAILSIATEDHQSAPKLAHRLDRDPDSYFRSRIRRLVVMGCLTHDFRGYAIAEVHRP